MVRVIDVLQEKRTEKESVQKRRALEIERHERALERDISIASRVLRENGFINFHVGPDPRDNYSYNLSVSTPCVESDLPESARDSDWIGNMNFNRLTVYPSKRRIDYSVGRTDVSDLAYKLADAYEKSSSRIPFLRKEWHVRALDYHKMIREGLLS